MNIHKKLAILSDAAKYDVSCSSSGSSRKATADGIGNGAVSGICHSWADDGRCISLLKILFTNTCIYDCQYCINRVSNDLARTAFKPKEIVDLTIDFYRRNYIEGLFLSSAIHKNPDYTMENLLQTVKLLREKEKFNGYIHLKAIPGADYKLIREAGHYADRMSVNIELPSNKSLQKLAPQKKKDAILAPMQNIGNGIIQNHADRKKYKKAPKFVPAGHSTQLIVGASPEPDLQILHLAESLYDRFNLKRVYYSAYMPVGNHGGLPTEITKPPLLREHRLYQADWLLRFYGFKADELLSATKSNFDLTMDPKADWAVQNMNLFPLEVNKADFRMLLRVPGIGHKSARRIVIARKQSKLSHLDLKKFGVVLKRANYFITCQGKYQAGIPYQENLIREKLKQTDHAYYQMKLFS